MPLMLTPISSRSQGCTVRLPLTRVITTRSLRLVMGKVCCVICSSVFSLFTDASQSRLIGLSIGCRYQSYSNFYILSGAFHHPHNDINMSLQHLSIVFWQISPNK